MTNSTETVKIWSVTNTFIHEFCGHYKAVVGMSLYSKGPCLITASLDKTVRLWNLKTFKEAYRINLKEPPLTVQVMDDHHLYVQMRKDVIIWFMDDISRLYAPTK
jgi:WD40 repeat protein